MVTENLKMAFGAVMLIGIMILTLSIFWPIIGDNLADVNDSTPAGEAAYGNFSEMYTNTPERTNTIITVVLAVVIIVILIGVYAYLVRVT